MSIRPTLTFRGIILAAFALILLGIAGFTFGERSYSAIFTALSPAGAEAEEETAEDKGAEPASKRKRTGADYAGGTNGKLIFGRVNPEPALKGSIGSIEPTAGSTPTGLTNAHESEPAWSPDGRKIVFISMRDGVDTDWYPEERTNREIYIMNADGTDQRRLTFNLSPEAQPIFSPDGTKILYVGMVDGDVYGDSGVFSMNLDGSNQTLLFDENCIPLPSAGGEKRKARVERKTHRLADSEADFYPGFLGIDTPNYAPDMSNIIFGTGFGASRGVYRYNATGGGCTLVAPVSVNSIEPRYSPDGTKIAINGNNFYLEILDVNGTLLNGYNPPGFDIYSTPIWSPDGTKIAFLGDIGDWGPETIRVFDLATQVTEIIYPATSEIFFNGLAWGNPSPQIPSITLAMEPYSVSGGQSVQATIQMDPATFPAGGGIVDLSVVGNTGVLTLPQATVTIPPGSTNANFTVNTLAQTNYNSADVVATYQTEQARATITVRPPKPDLSVINVTVPASVTFGTAFNVSWTTKNLSTSSTISGFRDEVFISRDNVWDASDSILTTVNGGALAGGAERTLTRSVTINASHTFENGQNYLIVVTNRNGVIDEGGSISNNALAQSFQMPLADLVAETLVVPAQSEPTVPYTLTWTLRNQGGRTTSSGFQSAVYFSSDSISGNADDILLLTINNTTLAAGASIAQSRSVTIPTVPVRQTGPSFFYVKVDSGGVISEGYGTGETNNYNFQPTQFDYRVADLQVTAASTAALVETQTAFPLEWTTTNAGNKAAPTFTEKVYFSTDNSVGGDIEIGSFELLGGLAAGASVNRIQNVTIQTTSVASSGNYYLYVKTDALPSTAPGTVDEGENENNNTRFHAVYVRRLLRPDLTVTNVTGPPTAFFDQTVQVQWTVTNSGAGPTNVPQWSDRLYIGTSPTSTSGATTLATIVSPTALNPGESYTATATVKIPRGFNGSYHFLVKTDVGVALNEENTTNNQRSNPIQVNVPPLPDLIVETVQAPDEVFAGQGITINYTVRNIGTNGAGQRRDRIYFSRDTTLSTSQDRLVFTSDNVSSPDAGQASSYVSRNRVGIQNPPVYQLAGVPSNMAGLWYVFVVADYSNDVYEFTGENNNINHDTAEPGSPMNILVSPPDLVVPNAPTAPPMVASGAPFTVDLMVRNQGAFNAAANLYHAVYLSTDQTFDAAADTLLGSIKDTDSFGPGAEHTVTLDVSSANCLANGTYYLFAVADYDGRQFEFDPGFDAEANNASPPRAIQFSTVPPDFQISNFVVSPVTTPGQGVTFGWTVSNSGGATTRNSSDRIYLRSTTPGASAVTLGSFQHQGGLPGGGSYSDSRSAILPAYMQGEYFISITTDVTDTVPECGPAEANNSSQSSNFTVQNNLPDLVLDSAGAPTTAVVGDSFNVQWTGRNANQAMPVNSPSWRDYVYLSTDATLGSGDVLLGSSLNQSPLANGQTYTRQLAVQTGNVAAGTYHMLVMADGARNIYEGPSSSTFETNNVRSAGVMTLTSPAVDLQVGAVAVSLPHHSGTYRDISWTVTNAGMTQTLATQWTDYVILSRDSILDATDTTLGYRSRNTALAGGASYTQTANLFIPTGLTGDYRVFVITDRNNAVVESSNTNNTSAPTIIDLVLPPPAEMSVSSITPPATISLGANATFSWTVQNTGSNAVNGKWRDTVYLSRDQLWDSTDTLVGIRNLDSQFTTVPAGSGSYISNQSLQIPPVEEGAYYVIVRTDSQNRIRESNESNNVTASTGTTAVTITQLPLNTPFNSALGNGAQQFFKYATEPAETLIFSLLTNIPARSNEVFTNFGTVVSRADYDFQSQRPGEGNQTNVIPETQEGDYYSMVRTDLIPESFAQNFNQGSPKPNPEKSQLGASVQPQQITVEAKILPFTIREVLPQNAGNAGYSTLEIRGAKFQQGATVKLIGPTGTQLLPVMVRVATAKIAALFDLKGTTAGVYDVVVTNPGGAVTTLADSFTIVTGGGHQLGQFTQGPQSYRAGSGGRFRYTVSARNDGSNDALNVPFIIDIPRVSFDLDRNNILDFPASAMPPGTPAVLPFHQDVGDRRVIMLVIPILRARTSVNFGVNLTIPSTLNAFTVNSVTLPPLAEIFAAGATQDGGQQDSLALMRSLQKRAPQASLPVDCWAEFARQFAYMVLNAMLKKLKGVGACGRFLLGLISGVSDMVTGGALNYVTGSQTDGVGAAFSFSGMLINFVGRVADEGLDCASTAITTAIPWYEAVALGIATTQLLYQLYQCLKPLGIDYAVMGLSSWDPNEKIGPEGYGGEKFVPDGAPLSYRVSFENLAAATAPAQRIVVTDVLPATLDPRTVRIKEIAFKQHLIVVPDDRAFYQNRIQLGEDLNNLQVDVLAGLDLVNRRVFWTLQAIDPATGEPPLDPLLGLLPPNNANRDGEGYVTFTVEPTDAQPTRTQLANTATIIFDANEAIVTNTTANLLDSGIPTSVLSPLPATATVPMFDLAWSGVDDATGSGLKGFDILYSEDGGAYNPYLLDVPGTSAAFLARWGKTYKFYSRARDNAGNVEAPPAVPDATIVVFGGDTEADLAPRPNGNDGLLSTDDTDQVRRFVAGLDTDFTYNEYQRSDVSPRDDGGDGTLSVADIMQARRFVANLDPKADAAGPNASAGLAPKTTPGKRSSLLPRELKPERIIRVGNQIQIGAKLEAQGDEAGVGFTLNFDPAVLSNPSVALGTDAAGGVLTVNSSQAAAGTLGITIDKAPTSPIAAGSRMIATITFTVAPGATSSTQVGFTSTPVLGEVVNGLANPLTTAFTAASIQLSGPTAAGVTVSGFVRQANGNPIRKARISIIDATGSRRTVLTSSFGHFRFDDVASGQNYTLDVKAKGYTFAPRLLVVNDEVSGLEITPSP